MKVSLVYGCRALRHHCSLYHLREDQARFLRHQTEFVLKVPLMLIKAAVIFSITFYHLGDFSS